MSRPRISALGALGIACGVVRSLIPSRPSVAAIAYDPARLARLRARVDAADRFDVFPDDDASVPFLPTDKATA